MLLEKLSLLLIPFAHLMKLQILFLRQVHVLNLLVTLLQLRKISALLGQCPLVARLRELDSFYVISRLTSIAHNLDGQVSLSVRNFLGAHDFVLIALIRRGSMELVSDSSQLVLPATLTTAWQ